MFISEIYHSRQGEGLLTGTPSVFVRTSGCNLRCGFCDTPFASWKPTGDHLSIDRILEIVHEQASLEIPEIDPTIDLDEYHFSIAGPTKHVVLTGGEPMLSRECVDLCQALHESGFHITIETAGTIDRELHCDLVSISPKLSNSDPSLERAGEWLKKHREARQRPEAVRSLIGRHSYQFKFVVADPADINEVLSCLDKFPDCDPSRVYLMPEGVDQKILESRESWLEATCAKHGFQVCRRLHILWYGNRRGT
jgi:7-carboxy-7-deazaguanine synthase